METRTFSFLFSIFQTSPKRRFSQTPASSRLTMYIHVSYVSKGFGLFFFSWWFFMTLLCPVITAFTWRRLDLSSSSSSTYVFYSKIKQLFYKLQNQSFSITLVWWSFTFYFWITLINRFPIQLAPSGESYQQHYPGCHTRFPHQLASAITAVSHHTVLKFYLLFTLNSRHWARCHSTIIDKLHSLFSPLMYPV